MRVRRAMVAGVLALAWGIGAAATETGWWVADTTKELLEGKGLGVAVAPPGRLEWTPGWTEAARFEEPIVSAVATDGAAAVVGTGFPAALYRIGEDGATLVAEVEADQVTTLLVAPDGTIWAGTMAPAAVFRLQGETLVKVGESGGDGIWALAWFDGKLVAAGGRPAALFRVGPQGLERWVELPDVHARSLTVDGDRLIVGTSGKGMVFAIDGSGQRSLIADSPFTEIASLAVGSDGSIWAAGVVGEPGGGGGGSESASSKAESDSSTKKASVTTGTANLKLPKVGGKTATSELLRITPDGAMLMTHRFTSQVASVLVPDGDGVLVGTGFEGEVWRFTPAGGSRLAVLDAAQITAMTPGGTLLLTQGPAAVFRRTARKPGRYRHDPLVLKHPARWGTWRLVGAQGQVRVRFRSGARKAPDGTWSEWSGWQDGPRGAVPSPPGTALQWEVELAPGASLERLAVAYREINLPPVVRRLVLHEPGAIYLASPPPTGQYVDLWHPDRNGIFTVLGGPQDRTRKVSGQGKRYWRTGFRTVSWKVEDPNGDPLRFRLELEAADGGPVLLIRDGLKGTRLGVDTTAVPDGRYRFRLTATDEAGNPGAGLTTTAVSRWFTVDNTPPHVTVTRNGTVWHVTANGTGSAVTMAEWSRDGAQWTPLAPEDGILDGEVERFTIPVKAGRHLLTVRVADVHHNRATAGTREE